MHFFLPVYPGGRTSLCRIYMYVPPTRVNFSLPKSRTGPKFWSFTPEQALPFDVLLQNRINFSLPKSRTGPKFWSFTPEQALPFEVLLQNRILFDNLVSNAWLKCQNPSCFQLLFPAASCLHFCSIILEQVFQAFYNWDQFESGHMYSSLNLTWIYHCG